MSDLVKLPREVAEALDYLNKDFNTRNILALILKGKLAVSNFRYDEKRNIALSVLRNYEFDDILLSLTNGYEAEKTPEEKVREYYLSLTNRSTPYDYDNGQMDAIIKTLNILNIKIDGVNK